MSENPQDLLADAVRAREERLFARSIQLLQQALAAGEAAANVYFQMGNTYADAAQWDEAAKAYLLALDADPTQYKAMHNLGVAYRHQGRFTDSVRCLKGAAKQQTAQSANGVELGGQGRMRRWTQLISLLVTLLLVGWLIGRIR